MVSRGRREKADMKRRIRLERTASFFLAAVIFFVAVFSCTGTNKNACAKEDVVVLRVCNWEEYIDLGDWDDEERIELADGVEIFGENSMIDDFEEWYYEVYGKKVQVEYSCFGTNEDLYNQLTLGDVYDLVCPSDYMIMKLMAEEKLEPFSEEFFNHDDRYNYYIQGVSEFISDTFEENQINGESWSKYAAGYMWGVTGVLYNPEKITAAEASTWKIFNNERLKRQITIKDNVRDSYFAALGALRADELTGEELLESEDYHEKLAQIMNDVSPETIADVEDLLQDIQSNVYSFETDSGKADMISGKVLANYQWSGDAVYAMDQAEEDGLYLNFAVPEECTNLWFDGWVMLKDGIENNADKKQAAEAFVNFLSRSDNAVRNMYYIGYTSVISGGSDSTVFDYIDWCYGADENETDTIEYPLGFFFSGDETNEEYIITAPDDQADRQLYAQYPPQEVLDRSAIMQYFDDDANKNINQMWINVRCYNINDVPAAVWTAVLLAVLAIVGVTVYARVRK